MNKTTDNNYRHSYRASDNHLYSKIGSEAVLLDLNSGVYYGLNEVGVDVWQWLQQPQTKESILDLLLAEYEVNSDEAKKDVQQILQEMLNVGLIEIV